MIVVVFEVTPKEGEHARYLDLAATMRPLVEEIDGFISVERFESLTHPGKLLSLSTFRDEAALDEWRKVIKHRHMQRLGRDELFEGYRLRVTSVIRDYGMEERDQAPADSLAEHG